MELSLGRASHPGAGSIFLHLVSPAIYRNAAYRGQGEEKYTGVGSGESCQIRSSNVPHSATARYHLAIPSKDISSAGFVSFKSQIRQTLIS